MRIGEPPTIGEGPVPLKALMDSPTSVRSIDLTVKSLTAVVVMDSFATKRRPRAPIELPPPNKELPPPINVILLGAIATYRLAHDDAPWAALKWVIDQARGDVDSREVWSYITAEAYIGTIEHWCPPDTAAALASEAVERHPEWSPGWMNLGYMLLLPENEPSTASDLEYVHTAAERACEAGAPDDAVSFWLGAIAWNQRDACAWRTSTTHEPRLEADVISSLRTAFECLPTTGEHFAYSEGQSPRTCSDRTPW